MLRAVHLLGVAPAPSLGVMDRLAASLASRLRVSCHVSTEVFDASFAMDPSRRQMYSTAVLARLAQASLPEGEAMLGLTEADLFVPVLTFVFGEAQMPGRAALVALHRLRDSYYGLPEDDNKLQQRLLKEAMHELGHTQGLRHCDDWRCVMVSSHAVERLDVKSADYCSKCALKAGLNAQKARFGGLL